MHFIQTKKEYNRWFVWVFFSLEWLSVFARSVFVLVSYGPRACIISTKWIYFLAYGSTVNEWNSMFFRLFDSVVRSRFRSFSQLVSHSLLCVAIDLYFIRVYCRVIHIRSDPFTYVCERQAAAAAAPIHGIKTETTAESRLNANEESKKTYKQQQKL